MQIILLLLLYKRVKNNSACVCVSVCAYVCGILENLLSSWPFLKSIEV